MADRKPISKSFTSEDLCSDPSPVVVKRRRGANKENTCRPKKLYSPIVNGLTAIAQSHGLTPLINITNISEPRSSQLCTKTDATENMEVTAPPRSMPLLSTAPVRGTVDVLPSTDILAPPGFAVISHRKPKSQKVVGVAQIVNGDAIVGVQLPVSIHEQNGDNQIKRKCGNPKRILGSAVQAKKERSKRKVISPAKTAVGASGTTSNLVSSHAAANPKPVADLRAVPNPGGVLLDVSNVSRHKGRTGELNKTAPVRNPSIAGIKIHNKRKISSPDNKLQRGSGITQKSSLRVSKRFVSSTANSHDGVPDPKAGMAILENCVEAKPVKSKARNRDVTWPGKKLFDEHADLPNTGNVDYENIENSNIRGYSDTDGDTEFSDDDVVFNYNAEENADESMNSAIQTDDVQSDTWAIDKMKLVPDEYLSLGGPTAECPKCKGQMWKQERTNKHEPKEQPKFRLCCYKGRVQLPVAKPTPPYLQELYDDKVKGPTFRRCVRIYNSMFSFTSMGGNVDHSINRNGAPYVYRLNGQNHHQFGSLLPKDGQDPRFCQLYIYDTENEVGNRMRWINVNDSNRVDPEIVEGLLRMLDETNQLVKCFRMARDRFEDDQIVDLKIVLKVSRAESGRENHITPSDEVAAIMVGDLEETCGRRDIIIDSKIDGLKRISDVHPLLMSLQYPLLFPYGDDGFHEKIFFTKVSGEKDIKRETVSMREYYAYMLQIRKDGGMSLRLGGRLFQQFIVDSFSAIEQSRLWWMRCNQKTLRNELYKHMCDYFKEGDGDLSNIGKGYILPSSFVGSKRYMQQNFQDALAVCRHIGHPDLFLTMTCNPMWDEVLQAMSLLPGCRRVDCPDIIARVFKLKLQQLTNDIKKKKFFGKCIAVMYVVEWQKRGLPHVHMLIWLDGPSKKKLNENVDKYVCAEIPNEQTDPKGYAAVKLFNIHGPCGLERKQSPCMKGDKCIRHFPKRYCAETTFDQCGFPIYRRRQTDNVVNVRKSVLDNQWVVPYNRDLLVRYQCHINIEICNRARCLKYLFKYCLKGSDRATVEVKSKRHGESNGSENNCVDEIRRFFDGRYICGAEAAHRIFAFDIHHRSISVERLPFHLEGEKRITYRETDVIGEVIEEAELTPSKLEAFFNLNQSDVEATQYTYDQIPQKYVWDRKNHRWNMRLKGLHIGRLCYTHHSTGEKWFLRMLLCKVPGPTSFKHLRTVNGTTYDTFQEACNAHGFLQNDNEWHDCLTECEKYGFPPQIRQLFVHIMMNCKVADLKKLWRDHWNSMADDIALSRRTKSGRDEVKLSNNQLQFLTLAELDKILRSLGKSLKDFKQLPQPPSHYLNPSKQNLIVEETSYDTDEMANQHSELLSRCNSDQRAVYNAVVKSVDQQRGGVFFVSGSGGCGKTYLWKTIITRLRSLGKIVLPVASSGIAATLLPGGRTAHSRFKIPIVVDEISTCDIAHKSDIAELLKKTDLIIWDEAPMQNRYAFESLDRTLRDIMKSVNPIRSEIPFGGITVVLGGDFRQILPVISKGSRSDIVNACITRSRLWDCCQVFTLKTNMRLNEGGNESEKDRITNFGRWILDVGDGSTDLYLTNNSTKSAFEDLIEIPSQYCFNSPTASVHNIIESTFPDIATLYEGTNYLSGRAILTPTNATVAELNKKILAKIPGVPFHYYSSDTAEEIGAPDTDFQLEYPVEHLNSLTLPGIPPHDLQLKVGAAVMLMRNLNQTLGLCNGTRLIVRRCLENAIECEVIVGNYVGTRHFIPRMELSPSDSRLPFLLIRKQFPVQICYAMTINKAQGQSLDRVGIYLPDPVFCHGQLYVALSRVTSPDGLKVLIISDKGKSTNVTRNVVFHEVFYSLPKT